MSTATAADYEDRYKWIKAKIEAKTTKSVTEATEVVNKLIKEYNSASRTTTEVAPTDGTYNDAVEFAKYKAKGLNVKLNSIGAATYTADGSKYSDAFNAKAAEMFKDDKKPTTSSEMIIADSLVFDENGIHFIYATYNTKDLKYKLTAKSSVVDGETVYDYEYDKNYYNDNEKISLGQLSTYYVLASFNTLFTDSETALTDYLIDMYPGKAPSDLDFKAYVTALDKYFVSETFINQYYLNLLKGGKYDTEYAKYSEIYTSFMSDILD